MRVVLDSNVFLSAMINNLQHAVILKKIKIHEEADDPHDSFLIAMAIMGKADFLVTGDKRAGLLKKKCINKTKVVTPNQFGNSPGRHPESRFLRRGVSC